MLYIMISIPICGEQTGNKLKLQPLNPTQHWSLWRPWGMPNSVPGGRPASACLEIQIPGGCHASICLRICQSWGIPGGQPALTCLGIWSLKGCHASACSRICRSRGPRRSTCLDLPRDPNLGRPTCLDLPGDLISRRLSCLSLPRDLHPDPGMPGSQVATVLDRISFRKTHP